MKTIDILKEIKKDLTNGTSYSVSYLTENEVEKTLSAKGIKIRKLFAPFLRQVYKTQTKYKLKKTTDQTKINKSGGKIFVLNHRQADDIVIGANAVGRSAYVVFGNKYLALETPNGLGLWAYGMILLDRNNKESRQASYEKMKYILKHHGNIIIFPEGYWNLDDNGLADERHGADQHNSENWLVQDINVGVIRLAKETGAPIIPTILHYDEFYKKRCYSKRGKPLYVKEGDNIFSKKDELVDQMTTMYYELMEKYSSYSKEELEKNNLPLQEQWEQLKKDLVKACDIPKIGYKLDLTQEKLIGKAKVANPVTTSQEVFQFTKRK